MLLLAILTSPIKPTKATNSDISLAIVGGIIIGAFFSAGFTSYFLQKEHEENVEKNNKKCKNAIEDLTIQIIILKEQLATKEAQNDRLSNEENTQKRSTFLNKLSPI